MTKTIPLSRAATQVAALLSGCLLVWASSASAFTPSVSKKAPGGENTPLELNTSTTGSHTSSGGASIVRTIVGLAIVIAVIWGLAWILRQVKTGREPRVATAGLSSVAALTLASGRTLHLVRAGNDYLLVGSGEHGLTPIHRYTEQQALEAGLLASEEPLQSRKRRINLGLLAPPAPQGPQSVTERPVGSPTVALPPSTSDGPRPSRTLESGERQTDPMRMPSPSSSAVERLREWTVRR
jgi:flagellar protein FliO/FliZ